MPHPHDHFREMKKSHSTLRAPMGIAFIFFYARAPLAETSVCGSQVAGLMRDVPNVGGDEPRVSERILYPGVTVAVRLVGGLLN